MVDIESVQFRVLLLGERCTAAQRDADKDGTIRRISRIVLEIDSFLLRRERTFFRASVEELVLFAEINSVFCHNLLLFELLYEFIDESDCEHSFWLNSSYDF